MTPDVLETCIARLGPANLPLAQAIASRLGIELAAADIAALQKGAGISGAAAARKLRHTLRVAPELFVHACPMSRQRWTA